MRAARGLAGDTIGGRASMAAVKKRGEAAARVATGAIQVQRRRIGGRARTMIMVSVVVGAILLYLRDGRNADDRAGWCDCCSVRLQAPATSSRGGEGGSGLGPWETRRAAAGSVCVCAEEAAGAGGGWEEAFARRTKKLCFSGLSISSKKTY